MTRMEPEIGPILAQWPPRDYQKEPPKSFYTRVPEADKTVAWPPRGDESRSSSVCSGGEPSQTIHLREDLPVRQEAVPVFATQPVVASVPRARGGLTWPPENSPRSDEQPPVRIQTPKLSRKNCPDGFQGRNLPNNYSGYRVAPGVLHMSPDAARYISDM